MSAGELFLAFAFEDCSRRVKCLLCKKSVSELVTLFRGEGGGQYLIEKPCCFRSKG